MSLLFSRDIKSEFKNKNDSNENLSVTALVSSILKGIKVKYLLRYFSALSIPLFFSLSKKGYLISFP